MSIAVRPDFALTCTLLAALAGPAAAQAVLRVDDDGGPGVDHTTLQEAIDASAEGGLVLVAPGSYAAFEILSRSVDIVAADPASPPLVSGSSRIEGLAPNQQVRLSGLEFDGTGAGFGLGALNVELCEGPVLIDRSRFTPSDEFNVFGAVLQYGLYARRSDRFVLSTSEAGRTADVANFHGVYALKSTAALFDCTTRGGMGIGAGDGFPGAGGDQSTFTLAGGAHSGGNGAPAFSGAFGGCTGPGDGGAGIALVGAFGSLSKGNALGFQASGGLAGTTLPSGGCPPAVDGAGLFTDPFSVLQVQAGQTARSQSFAPVVVSGQPVDVTLSGKPADPTWLLVSPLADLRPALVDFGATPLAVGANPLLVFLGALDAAGSLQITLGTPTLPAGAAALLVTQPAFADANGQFVLGNPLTLTLLAEEL